MLKPGVLEAAGVRPEREKHQESNAELKRESRLHLRPDVNRPSERERLLRHIRLNMNFMHSKSGECVKTELDLFSVPPTQVSLEKGLWIDHQPVSGHRGLRRLVIDHFGSSHKGDKSKREQSCRR